jgi:hypothetical protein
MNRIRSSHRPRYDRRRPNWDTLEDRFVLSPGPLGPNLTILASDPAPGDRLSAPTSRVTFTFDRPLYDGSTGFTDFQVDRVDRDGSLTPMIDPNVGAEEDLDPTGTALTVVLDRPLSPGEYELFLSGSNGLTGVDGSMFAGDGSDQPLGSFTVSAPGKTLASASDLGAITPAGYSVGGSLDFRADPFAVALYQVSLPTGHHWQFGAEISAQRIGSPLSAALSLFDAQGNPITTSNLGRADAPADPYLFAGLAPGTYYIGVSGADNVPGKPGGYNPVTGDPGSHGQAQAGGFFHLEMAADEADEPARVTSFQVDHADGLGGEPTGFEIQFSKAIDVAGPDGSLFTTVTQGLEVVDSAGRSWPIAGVAYDESQARLTYLFREQLAPGNYLVRLPAQGGLTDLAGLPPVAKDRDSGILASFKVNPDHNIKSSLDFGPLFPNDVLSGVSRSATIAPGNTVTFRYTSLYSDNYQISTQYSGGSVSMTIELPGGQSFTEDPGSPGTANQSFQHLGVGTYLVHVTATGTTPVQFTSGYRIPGFAWETILDNGVGQGPALSLRLIAPTPTPGDTTGDSAPAATPTTEAPAAGAAGTAPGALAQYPAAAAAASPTGVGVTGSAHPETSAATATQAPGASIGTAGLFLSVASAPVGQPSFSSATVATAAFESGTGTGGSATGALAGIGYGSSDRAGSIGRDSGDLGESVGPAGIGDGEALASAPTSGAITPGATTEVADRALEGVVLEGQGLALADIMAGLRQAWETGLRLPETTGAGSDAIAVADRGGKDAAGDSTDVAEAGFGHPLGAGLAAILLLQSRHRVRRWLKRTNGARGAGSWNRVLPFGSRRSRS